MSRRTSSRSTFTIVPSTMSPSLKYLIVESMAARKSSSLPMSLIATWGVVGVSRVLVKGMVSGCGQGSGPAPVGRVSQKDAADRNRRDRVDWTNKTRATPPAAHPTDYLYGHAGVDQRRTGGAPGGRRSGERPRQPALVGPQRRGVLRGARRDAGRRGPPLVPRG